MSWEAGFVIGTVLLGVALLYGVLAGRRTSPAAEAARDAGTRAVYAGDGDRDAPPRDGRPHRTPPLVWVIAAILAAWVLLSAVMALRSNEAQATNGSAVNSALEPLSPGSQQAPATTPSPAP